MLNANDFGKSKSYFCLPMQEKNCLFLMTILLSKIGMEKLSINLPAIDYLWFVL